MADVAILVGSILVAFVCAILLVGSVLFAAGVSLDWFQLPVASAMATGFGWWLASCYIRQGRVRALRVAVGVSGVAFLLSVLLNSMLHDVSWDGQTYHAEAIAQLAAGWNPFVGGPLDQVGYPTELSFFSKGSWISAAALYKVTGNFETGKAFHLTLMVACCCFWMAALSGVGNISRRWILLLSVTVAFNPVSTYQMHSYYVDGQLCSLLASAVALMILIDRRGDGALMVVLAMVVALTINVKLTGALYIAVMGSGYWLWYAIARRTRSIELAAWLLAGGALGGILIGYNPYITQFANQLIRTGNPFYPHSGWREIVTIESEALFPGMGRVERLLTSLLARSEVSPSPPVNLKPPFTVSLTEIKQFASPDVRVGGFGPLFSGALLLSMVVSALLIRRYRRPWCEHTGMVVLMALIGVSTLLFSETWWARFAPHLWLIPMMVGVVGLCAIDRGHRRWLSLALIITLCLNSLLICARYVTFAVKQSIAVTGQLGRLELGAMPVTIDFNEFSGTRYRFEQHHIRYTEVETLPCAEGRRERVVMSEAEFCRPE